MIKKMLVLLLLLLVLASCRSAGTAAGPERSPSRFYVDFGRGVAALERNDFASAIQSLNLAVAAQPGSARALNLRGLAFLMSGKTREARADFERVIVLDPGFAPAYQNLGCALEKEKKPAEAETVLRRGLERFPASAEIHFTLGSVLVSLGRTDEALAVMRRGLELEPDFFAKERQFSTGAGPQDGNGPELFFSYARLFAAMGDAAKTAEYLRWAKKAGFREWQRIAVLADFDPVRADPALQEFLK